MGVLIDSCIIACTYMDIVIILKKKTLEYMKYVNISRYLIGLCEFYACLVNSITFVVVVNIVL